MFHKTSIGRKPSLTKMNKSRRRSFQKIPGPGEKIMEIALIIYMCSAIQNTCLDPYIWPETFYDNYGCMIQGYKESGKKDSRNRAKRCQQT